MAVLLGRSDGAFHTPSANEASIYTSLDIGWPTMVIAADFNKDGTVTTQDFFDYLNAWADRSIFADWDYDGAVNTIDFLAFLNDYAKG